MVNQFYENCLGLYPTINVVQYKTQENSFEWKKTTTFCEKFSLRFQNYKDFSFLFFFQVTMVLA